MDKIDDRIQSLKQVISEEAKQDFSAELQAAEERYAKDLHPSADHNFAYATTLIRSRSSVAKTKKGMGILRGLLDVTPLDQTFKRDCIYYIAYGHFLLDDYDESRKWISLLLKLEPNNSQALALKSVIEDKVKKEGIIGAVIVGGVVAALGAAAVITARALKR